MPDLDRFVSAQSGGVFERALGELEAGTKTGHWIWFVFPQISGLGHSETARQYAIADLAEAEAFCAHPLLGLRLAQATDAMLAWANRRTAETILGPVDAMKFRSAMTLFAQAGGNAESMADGRFAQALRAFYPGPDPATLQRL